MSPCVYGAERSGRAERHKPEPLHAKLPQSGSLRTGTLSDKTYLEFRVSAHRPRVVECLLTLKRCHEAERQSAEVPRASLPPDSALRPAPGSAGSQQPSASGGLAAALRARHTSPVAADSPDINYDQVAQVCWSCSVAPLARANALWDSSADALLCVHKIGEARRRTHNTQIIKRAATWHMCTRCLLRGCAAQKLRGSSWPAAGAARPHHQCIAASPGFACGLKAIDMMLCSTTLAAARRGR